MQFRFPAQVIALRGKEEFPPRVNLKKSLTAIIAQEIIHKRINW